MKRIIIYGFFIACIVTIFMNLKVNISEPKPEEEMVANNCVKNATISSIPTQNCHFASIEGRRSYQEDRVTCDVDLKLPFFGRDDGLEEVSIGVVAVFDGHIGSTASEMASRVFLEFTEIYSGSTEGYSGSTAVVALIYNKTRVLVANVGDSKAFICSQKLAKELTEDHNAYRLEERVRIEALGGEFDFFSNDNVPLLFGDFPMTRAIGDVGLKNYGIIATPEVTDWLNLTSKDEFLVVASDGIFESLSPQKVCGFLHEAQDHSNSTLLAQQIVQKAFLEGSRDHLSVVLVPLESRDLL